MLVHGSSEIRVARVGQDQWTQLGAVRRKMTLNHVRIVTR